MDREAEIDSCKGLAREETMKYLGRGIFGLFPPLFQVYPSGLQYFVIIPLARWVKLPNFSFRLTPRKNAREKAAGALASLITPKLKPC